MARWDEILSLPVQNPPSLEFSAADLVWSKIEGWRDNIDRLALIPFTRVDDFVRGESANKDCPTRFHVEARRRRPPESSYKKKVDGILEYILYWCSFGPDDHRKGGIVRPSRNTYVPKKKNAGRPNTKRGCTCHFIVKRLIAEPSVALIIYNQDKHVDKKGLPCHGPQDKKAEGTRAMFAPYISEDLRLRVLSLLYVGVSVETIMQRHSETVEKQGGPTNRDDLLTHRYVRRQERSIRRSSYELDADDAISLSLWVESHQSHVFFFEDFSDADPFTLGIQTEWQLQQMIRFGNRGILASDSRFGTNKLKYPVHSLIVFNSDNKAIPVAWIITPRFASADAHKWMRALYNRVHSKDPCWKLAGFVVDDPLADILTIRDVFQCSVLISFWRVRHAWHKNLIKRCLANEMRVEMSKRLGQAVEAICGGNGHVSLFDDFMEDFVDCSDFVDYFKAIWYPKIGTWSSVLKTLPLASQETCAAMEFYHNQLKVRLLNEKDFTVYQRADWLVDKLGTKVHSYFWLDEYSEKDVFARYWKDEWASGLTAWRKALKIPDTDVIMEGRTSKVIDQLDRDRIHVVWNPGSEYAICDCSWAEMGNLCEHVFKVIRKCREKGQRNSSISLLQYKQALVDMLHCPRHDSLIRDHAISLAVAVQKQLDALVGSDNGRTPLNSNQKHGGTTFKRQVVGEEATNRDRELIIENTLSNHEDDSANALNSSGIEIGNSGQGVREDNCRTHASIDTPSISNSPCKVDESSENRDKGMDCTDTGENLPSKDENLTDQVGLLQNEAMDIDQPPADTPMPMMESLEQCTVTKQRSICDDGPVSNTEITDSQSNKISTSLPEAVDSEMTDVSEILGTVAKDKTTETEAGNKIRTENHCSNDNASVVNEADDNNTDTSDLDHANRAVVSNANSESLPITASASSQIDKEHPAKDTGAETGSGDMKTLTNKVDLAACSLQKDAAAKRSIDEISRQPESDCNTIANVANSGSEKHHVDADGVTDSES